MTRRLIKAYGVAFVLAVAAAIAAAEVGDWWAHYGTDRRLLLLPTSNIRFWFLAFLPAACAVAARRCGVPAGRLAAATGVIVLAAVWSVCFWWSVGASLGAHWTPQDVAAVMNSRSPGQLLGGVATLTGLLLFAAGLAWTIRRARWSDRAG